MADLPPGAYGHVVSGTFRPLTGDAAADGVQASGYKSVLFWLRVVLGRRYRSSQITIRTAEARALSVLFKPGPVTVDVFVMRALGTLTHEEFHAINVAGWHGVIFEMLVRTPALRQFTEGIIDAGVEDFLPDLLPKLGMAGLKKSLRFLQFRRVYVAQKLAVRRLLEYAELLAKRPSQELLRTAIKNGSGLVALRNLAHEIARVQELPDRAPESRWPMRQFWLPPKGAEARLVGDIMQPFETLASWYERNKAPSIEEVIQQGIETGEAITRGLERSLDRAA